MCDLLRRRFKLEARRLARGTPTLSEQLDKAGDLVRDERDGDLVLRVLGCEPWSATYDRVMGLRDDSDDEPVDGPDPSEAPTLGRFGEDVLGSGSSPASPASLRGILLGSKS